MPEYGSTIERVVAEMVPSASAALATLLADMRGIGLASPEVAIGAMMFSGRPCMSWRGLARFLLAAREEGDTNWMIAQSAARWWAAAAEIARVARDTAGVRDALSSDPLLVATNDRERLVSQAHTFLGNAVCSEHHQPALICNPASEHLCECEECGRSYCRSCMEEESPPRICYRCAASYGDDDDDDGTFYRASSDRASSGRFVQDAGQLLDPVTSRQDTRTLAPALPGPQRCGVMDRPVGVEVECITNHNTNVVRWADKWNGSVGSDGSVRGTSSRPNEQEIRTTAMGGPALTRCILELGAALKEDGAAANDSCGLHVHVYSRDLDWRALLRTVNLYSALESALYVTQPARRESNNYCQASYMPAMLKKSDLCRAVYGENASHTFRTPGTVSDDEVLRTAFRGDSYRLVTTPRGDTIGFEGGVPVCPITTANIARCGSGYFMCRLDNGWELARPCRPEGDARMMQVGRWSSYGWKYGDLLIPLSQIREMLYPDGAYPMDYLRREYGSCKTKLVYRPGCNWKSKDPDWGPGRLGKGYHGRYRGLNLHSHFYRGSLEFRLGAGTVDSADILAWSSVCQAIVESGVGFSTAEWKNVCRALRDSAWKGLVAVCAENGLPSRVTKWIAARVKQYSCGRTGHLLPVDNPDAIWIPVSRERSL